MDSLKVIFEEHDGSIAACIFEPMVQGAADAESATQILEAKLQALWEAERMHSQLLSLVYKIAGQLNVVAAASLPAAPRRFGT